MMVRASDRDSYSSVRDHLDEIAAQIKNGDTSLDQCLDLYEEAIALGNSCAELIDTADFSAEEFAQMTDDMDGAGDRPAEDGMGQVVSDQAADDDVAQVPSDEPAAERAATDTE